MAENDIFAKIEKIKMPIRILILVGTVVVIGVVVFFFIYKPYSEDIKEVNESISKVTLELNRAKIRAKDEAKLNNELEQANTQLQEALKLLPNDKEIPALIKKVTQLGDDSDLDLRLFRPKREIPKEFYVEIPVSLEIRGNYHNVAVFFDKIGHMERIMNILNVSMKPIKGGSTTLITTCDAVTYRFKGQTNVQNKKRNKKK